MFCHFCCSFGDILIWQNTPFWQFLQSQYINLINAYFTITAYYWWVDNFCRRTFVLKMIFGECQKVNNPCSYYCCQWQVSRYREISYCVLLLNLRLKLTLLVTVGNWRMNFLTVIWHVPNYSWSRGVQLAVRWFVLKRYVTAARPGVFSARCNIYISRLCYDVSDRLSVCPSVCLSVTEVHWRIIANLGFKFRSQFTAHCGRGACGRDERDHRREEWRDHLAQC